MTGHQTSPRLRQTAELPARSMFVLHALRKAAMAGVMDAAWSSVPVILLDPHGYAFYRDPDGRSFFAAGRYAVRLVTGISQVSEAVGAELDSVVGVRGGDESAAARAVRFLYSLDGDRVARLAVVSERLLLLGARLRGELSEVFSATFN
jgi:hypothetical protein